MKPGRAWRGYAWAAGATAACTLAGTAMQSRFDPVNIAMVYILAVVFVALRHDRGPAIVAALLSVLAFDLCFVPPVGTLNVDDAQYLFTFAILLAVALVISGLKAHVQREEAERSRLVVEAETQRVRGTLLASISHDLRTPLAVMSGASSSLVERGEQLDPSERVALARAILGESRAMTDRVEKLLQMTRLQAGAFELARDWASIGETIASALGRFGEALAAHRLVVEVPDDLPLVRIDAVLIEQAVGNLLENAAKHTPPGTAVRVVAAVEGSEMVVSIEDFAGALASGDEERVFALFQHGAAERAGGGIGLGLSICRAIVRLHGGRAWAERIPGGGTAFRFTLPVEAVPAIPPEPGA